MIAFNWHRVDRRNNNTPVISDAEIDKLAAMLLRDYKPQLLKEPGKIKYDHFLESYLGVNLDYKHIYYEEDAGRILGVTAFSRGLLPIFDRENLCLDEIVLEKDTIVLDLYVTAEGREGLELFTGLHEGGHFWMHQQVYAKDERQLSLLGDAAALEPVICCRKDDVESFGRKGGIRTPEQWREHQADYFAAALAMPKATFVPFVQETLAVNGIPEGRLIENAGLDEIVLATKILPKIVSEVYGVSKAAAYVRLRKTGLVVDWEIVKSEEKQQLVF